MTANPDGPCAVHFHFRSKSVAKHILDKDQNTSWYIDESNDTWILTKGTSLSVSSSTAIGDDQSQHDNKIIINGSVEVYDPIGTHYAVQIYGADTDINVGIDGGLKGPTGAVLSGSRQSLTNNGEIDGTYTGVSLHSDHGTVNNSGAIRGSNGIEAFGDAGEIINHEGGEITAKYNAIHGGAYNVKVVNDGRIEGGVAAIFTAEGNDRITNHGKLIGDVTLGDGKDVFDTRGGIVKGTVDGGDGDDTYLVSNAALDINESFLQGGTDTVKSTVSYEINTAIENITLLGKGDINATASDVGNILRGNKGDNILRGLGGMDMLIGGKGNDRLFGGELGDEFVFKTGDGRDVIADFHAMEGDVIDLAGMDAIKNFKDLVNHHLDVSGNDLLITAGDDLIRLKNVDEADLKATMFDFA
jgi:Ca2+-binding RTX toxin-like protein